MWMGFTLVIDRDRTNYYRNWNRSIYQNVLVTLEQQDINEQLESGAGPTPRKQNVI